MTDPTQANRREFLKQTTAGAAALAVAPQILARAADASVLGAGAHTYEWVDGWAKLPQGKVFGNTHAIQEDSQGRIFVHNTGPEPIMVFDADGKYIKGFGKEWEKHAHGMQLRKEADGEFLYLAPTTLHKVYKVTLDGEIVLELTYPKDSGAYEDETKYVPTNIAVAANGDFYVADGYGKSFIHQYTAKGDYVRSWGGVGAEAGKMNCCHGIWIDTRSGVEEIVVADRANVRLQYFSLDGQHLRFVTDDLIRPCHFDQREGDLLIPDLFGRVTIFDKDNKLITHLGENPGVEKLQGYPDLPKEQRTPGKFISPHGATWDRAGNIFVGEWVPDGRVTKLRRVS
jgi:hypothetical protein